MISPEYDALPPIIDMHNKGIGDIVVACWLIHSAKAVGRALLLNPRGRDAICRILTVDKSYLTDAEASNWAKTDGLGHRHEYALVAKNAAKPRFKAWAESLDLADLN